MVALVLLCYRCLLVVCVQCLFHEVVAPQLQVRGGGEGINLLTGIIFLLKPPIARNSLWSHDHRVKENIRGLAIFLREAGMPHPS